MTKLKDTTQLDDSKINVIKFTAPWCNPCKRMAVVMNEVTEQYASDNEVQFYEVDIDKSQHIASQYGVMSVPTVMFLNGITPMDTQIGLSAKSSIVNKINKLHVAK